MKRLMLIAVVLVMCTGSVCGGKVIRDGVEVNPDEARRMDLEAGDKAFAEGKYDEAAAAYSRYISDFPRADKTPYALYRSGLAYFLKGDCKTARLYLNEVLSNHKRSPYAPDAASVLARCAYQEGDCDEVIDLFKNYHDLATGESRERMSEALAECAADAGDYYQAAGLYGEILIETEDETTGQDARAKILSLAAAMEKADLVMLAAQYPDSPPGDAALVELIKRSLAEEDYETAAIYMSRLESGHPYSPYLSEVKEFREVVARRVRVKPDRIGLMLPLSGKLAPLGEAALQGVMLAVKVFNPGEAAWTPSIYIKDTGPENADMEALVEELINEDQVIAIIGPLLRSNSRRAAIKAQELGVPLISLNAGEEIPLTGDMVYQNALTKSEQVKVLVEHSLTLTKNPRFGVLYPDSSYGVEYLDLFISELRSRGLDIGVAVPFPADATDFRKEIRELKNSGVNVLFLPDYSWKGAAMVAPQLRFYMVSNVFLLGVNAWHDEALLFQTQPEDLTHTFFTDGIAPEANRPLFKQFVRNFKAEFNREPRFIETQSYEAADLVITLIERYRIRDRVQLKEAMDHVRDFPGVTGGISIDGEGRFRKPVYLFAVKERGFVVMTQYEMFGAAEQPLEP